MIAVGRVCQNGALGHSCTQGPIDECERHLGLGLKRDVVWDLSFFSAGFIFGLRLGQVQLRTDTEALLVGNGMKRCGDLAVADLTQSA